MQLSLWQRAARFAARAHRDQVRADDTPFIVHPFRVTLVVRHLFGCDDSTALCTALLHDVIEDTGHDYDDVADEFGQDVADAVACLSKDKRLEESRREPAFYRQIAAGPWQAKLVKLADCYDNISDAASGGEKSVEKAIGKGHAAIESAGDDPRLEQPIALLRQLIEQAERSGRQED